MRTRWRHDAGRRREIPFLYQRAETRVPHGPAPRTADGKPDLSGVWFPSPDLEPLDLAKFIQTPDLVVVLVELSVPGVRQIFLDGRTHPPNLQPTWQGHSIGRWEKDTLVVDTIGFNDKGWLDGSRPQTEQLHVIERFRRIDLGHMELETQSTMPARTRNPGRCGAASSWHQAKKSGVRLQREQQDRTLRGAVTSGKRP